MGNINKEEKNIKKSNPKFTTYTLSISEYRFLEELLGHTLYYYSILKNGRNECFTKKLHTTTKILKNQNSSFFSLIILVVYDKSFFALPHYYHLKTSFFFMCLFGLVCE